MQAKALQTDLGTFRHYQAYPGITQAYSGIFRTQCNPGIFRTGISRTRSIFRTLAYSQPWYIENAGTFKIQDLFRILSNICNDAFCIVERLPIVNSYN